VATVNPPDDIQEPQTARWGYRGPSYLDADASELVAEGQVGEPSLREEAAGVICSAGKHRGGTAPGQLALDGLGRR
jgi:hypothetical protein